MNTVQARKNAVLLVLKTLCCCSKPRQSFSVWLGSCQLSHTGMVLDIEMQWPTLGIVWYVLRAGDETNNFLNPTNFATMPEHDLSGLLLRCSISNFHTGIAHTRTYSNVAWHALGYLLWVHHVDGITPGSTCRLEI